MPDSLKTHKNDGAFYQDNNLEMTIRSFLIQLMLKRQKGFFDKLEEFEKTQYWSESELRAYQQEKLRKLMKHAYETVPFYKELFDNKRLKPNDIKKIEDLQKLPVLDKETLRSNRERLISTDMNEKSYFRRTGGSTGVPLSIANNYSAAIIEQALFYRFLRWMGYEWGDEIIEFWGEPVVEPFTLSLKKRISRAIHNKTFVSTFSVNEEVLFNFASRITKFPPKILRGYASSIYLLALKSLELGVKIKLNAVSATAEKLFPFQRDKIRNAFGENIFDQYGCGETNSLAFECERHKGFHVASEHVVLETLDEKRQSSSSGKVAITNLDDYAMPIIRYNNGDVARWASGKCSCGRHSPLLVEIEGRVSDFIEGLNGNKVHAEFFAHILGGLDIATKYSIKEFRVVQEKIDKLRIEFVTEDDLCRKDKQIFGRNRS